MLSDSSKQEVDRLAALLREDRLEAADSERLVQLIRHHPQARRYFVKHLYLDANLKDAIPTLESLPDSEVITPIKVRWAIAGLAVAAVLALVMVVKSMLMVGPAGSGGVVVNADEFDSEGIAVVSKASEVLWGEATTIPVGRLGNGSPVGPGVLELESGVVQIDFYSGATVILEGPAQIQLESPVKARLDFGVLWAHVPPPARGFTVETSDFEVVDLGTEFGLRVGRDGDGEVHVLDGEVEVMTTQEDGSRVERSLKTGEGVRMGVGGRSEEIRADGRAFPVSKRLSSAAKARFKKWQVYHQRLAEDPDMLVSYTFPEVAAWERTVRNRATAASRDTDGAIVGCEWREGRWPEKGALAYANSSHRLRVNVPGEFEELTMACWVKLDELVPHSALLKSETSGDRFVHWTLISTPNSVYGHFSETDRLGDGVRNHYHGKNQLFDKRGGSGLGEWMHVAVVYDPKARLVTHYHNGKEIGSTPIEQPRLLGIGNADIGNWPYVEWAAGTPFEVQNLKGALDEFLIMKRAWSAEEIEALWEVGRP